MFNQMILLGRITQNIELKTSQNGTAFCKFSVACDRKFQKQGEERKSDFFNVVCWRQTAEFVVRNFSKGSAIFVEGEMQTSTYTDKDGIERMWYEIIADRVSFTGGGSRKTSDQPNENSETLQSTANTQYSEQPAADDYPF